jgi:two-component system NtrC family sensor kinase
MRVGKNLCAASDKEIGLFTKWPIWTKLLICFALLAAIVATLSVSSFNGLYAYRHLVKTLGKRAAELPLANDLNQAVGQLNSSVVDLSRRRKFSFDYGGLSVDSRELLRERFIMSYDNVKSAAEKYRDKIQRNRADDSPMGSRERELDAMTKVELSLLTIDHVNSDSDWMLNEVNVEALQAETENLVPLAAELPTYLYLGIEEMADQVRNKYRTLIVLVWVTSISAALALLVFVRLVYVWVFQPLRDLIRGSRRLAAGDFDHRIPIVTQDEMAELARAMNNMTGRFQEIRDDLDSQVRERTKQVVRSEQMASVGFLAAGVAHEINNPLASIAMCAESLESRMHQTLQADDELPDGEHNEEIVVLRNYLRMIQDEAFRCKQITEKLLDFSRMGDTERHPVDLREVATDVIEMVGHLGKYKNRNKTARLLDGGPIMVSACSPEMKQVVLNLVANGLDSVAEGGAVEIEVRSTGDYAEIVVTDNGCGMSDEIIEHLFEPFFTNRREGQGTGLGLSITYRIVEDHRGHIEASSDGPGQGAQFRVRLPLLKASHNKKTLQTQAA